MKRGLILTAAGVTLIVASAVLWSVSRPSGEAGDVAAVERALTATVTDAPSPGDTTPQETAQRPAPSIAPDPAPSPASVPTFTVADEGSGPERVPVGLRIPDLGVDASIVLAGVESNGDMQVPRNVDDVGWYKYGSAPGEPGSAVLAAHVDLAGQGPGVFFDLRSLDPGDVIYVIFDDGALERYEARARTIYDKTELPLDAIFSREGMPVLTLITCGGGFNRNLRTYDSNVVVYAVPAGTQGSIPAVGV
jgi:sortase (surface protein transpeptidase)